MAILSILKALEFVVLAATAADMFGAVTEAARWPTRRHPALDGETPLRRVHAVGPGAGAAPMLGGLKYSAPA